MPQLDNPLVIAGGLIAVVVILLVIPLLLKPSGVTAGNRRLSRAKGAQEPPWVEDVRDHLRRGDKIAAVKLYREKSGLSLKEAADEIEDLVWQESKSGRSG